MSSALLVMRLLIYALAIRTHRSTAMDVPGRIGVQAQLAHTTSATLPTETSAGHRPQVTHPLPRVARRAISLDIQTLQTIVMGNATAISQVFPGSICGFVTNNVHWPLYCNEGQYCDTVNQIFGCCSSMSPYSYTETYFNTFTSTVRNSYVTTSVSTESQGYYGYSLFNCGYAAPSCYDSTDASSCTGSCATAALICTDKYFPYCASLYSSASPAIAKSYFCDTTGYGLEYGNFAYWPSVTSTYTSTMTISWTLSSTVILTWTPTVVPYSRRQSSIASAQATLQAPADTSASVKIRPGSMLSYALIYLSLITLYKIA